jgi:tetratricopeptide (TPR) repeat protein
MTIRSHCLPARGALAALVLLELAVTAAAQGAGGFAGEVEDETGAPVRGATVTAEDSSSVPSVVSAITDEHGRFSLYPLAQGRWRYVVAASGYELSAGRFSVGPPKVSEATIRLRKSGVNAVLGVTSREIQGALAEGDELYAAKQYDEAIAVYSTLLEKAPALHFVNLHIAQCYRDKRDYDKAIEYYREVLKNDPGSEDAKLGIGVSELDKGDLRAADAILSEAAANPAASKETFYNLGEAKFALGDVAGAAPWFQKAADADATWGRPLLRLALVAVNRGDKEGAIRLLQRVIAIDPASPDATEARTIAAQLQK